MPNHNPSMPQARYFFSYIMWKEEQLEPLQKHVVFGFERESLEETRRLVQSGAQISELLYLGEVCELRPHHHRRLQDLTETITPEDDEDDEEAEIDTLAAIATAKVVPS